MSTSADAPQPTETVTPTTLTELEAWMQENCVNDHAFRIGPTWPVLADGHAVTQEEGEHLFFYVERGQRSHIERFDTEAQVCRRAFDHLRWDKWSSAYLVGFFPDQADALAMQARLAEADIVFHADRILYRSPDDFRYRVIVFGRDVERVAALEESA
jgi:hypothetical protein